MREPINIFGLSIKCLERGKPRLAAELLLTIKPWALEVGFAEALLRLASAQRMCGAFALAGETLLEVEGLESLDQEESVDLMLERIQLSGAAGDTKAIEALSMRIQATISAGSGISPSFQLYAFSVLLACLCSSGINSEARRVLRKADKVAKAHFPPAAPLLINGYYSHRIVEQFTGGSQ